MKSLIKKNNFFVIFFIVFVFALLGFFVHQIIAGYAKESWQITEWLINYQGGFVRRGLWGEIILNLYNHLGLNPYVVILVLSGVCYFILLTIFIKLFIKNGYSLFILPFVFFLGGPIINNFWVRKDVLIMLIFSLIIYLARKKTNINIILINLIFIIGLLTHESIGFFCFPILFLIFFHDNLFKFKHNLTKSILVSLTQLFPSLLVFFSTLYYKGSFAISNIIWGSWKGIAFPIQNVNFSGLPAAIDGLSWSLKKGLSLSFSLLYDFNYGVYAPVAWAFIFLSIYYILTNLNKMDIKILNYKFTDRFNRKNISNILILQFLSITPLFILGWDYGRWVFLWVTSSFFIFLLLPEEKISNLFPPLLSAISIKINKGLDYILSKYKKFIIFATIFLGVPGCSWSLLAYISSSSLGFIFKIAIKFINLF